MNRFTKELWDGCPIEEWSHFVELDGNETKVLGEGWAHPVVVGGVIDRLAAYEDSQMTPEEVVEIKKYLNMWIEICKENNVSIVQFKKWAEAEQDGRLVVLPCKVGDVVYIAVKEWDARYCLKSSFVPCVREGTVAHICISHKGIIVCVTVKGKYSEYYEFGKTVFLTREEAEKAIGGGKK